MELRISTEGDDGAALSSLYRWLNDDRAVSADVGLSASGDPVPGSQSVAFDFILAVTNTAAGVASLAISYATWRDAHRRKETIVFEGEGRILRVVDGSEATTRRIVEAFPGVLSTEAQTPESESSDLRAPAPEIPANQEP